MPRDIFHTGEISEVTQGCVFFGGIADGIDHPVHGVIITPRCNIAQNKVATLHYLPISNFKDWKKLHLASIYQFEEMKSRKNALKPMLISKGIEESIVEESILNGSMSFTDEALEGILAGKGLKESQIEDVKSYRKLYDLNFCHSKLSEWGKNKLESRISSLVSGNMEKFLLLESPDEKDGRYFVIHLTEIRHIRIETARTMLTCGVRSNWVDSEKDDLFQTDVPNVYRIKYRLKSPYVDYVCQHLANAFFRIGIEDFDGKAVSEKLKSMIAE